MAAEWYAVVTAGRTGWNPTLVLRYTDRRVTHVNPGVDSDGFIDDVEAGTGATDADVLLACSEESAVSFAGYREDLDPVVPVPAPEPDVVGLARAVGAGLPTSPRPTSSATSPGGPKRP